MTRAVVSNLCAAVLLRVLALRKRPTVAALILGGLLMPGAGPLHAQTTLARHYQDGEKIAYTISCFNQGRARTTAYEARAEGAVRKDASGAFVEDLAWTDLNLNDEQVRLSDASRAFRETLSLAQGARLALPPLGGVQAGLFDPISDLLTFYADLKIAMNQKNVARAGDHAYVTYGTPISWADGKSVILGQDAVDFDVTLQSIDPATRIATVVVRHVPPPQPRIKLPAPWMSEPWMSEPWMSEPWMSEPVMNQSVLSPSAVSQSGPGARVRETPNNWVQVEKTADGKYVAAVGQETFDVRIRIALGTGRMVSATIDNPVSVVERACTDAALTACGAPERFTTRRQITLRADPTPAQVPAR